MTSQIGNDLNIPFASFGFLRCSPHVLRILVPVGSYGRFPAVNNGDIDFDRYGVY
jgi:hypothetical protein